MEGLKPKMPEDERAKAWRFTVKNFNSLLPPEPLAEHLEPSIALAGMRHCMTLRKAEGHFSSAWHHVEYAMNQQADYLTDDIRRKYFNDAVWLLGGIIESKGQRAASPNLMAQVLTLSTYLPVLTKRAIGEEVTSNDCADIYHSLGWTLKELEGICYVDTSYRGSRYAEILGLALSARPLRPDALLYPSSPREEASSNAPLNHDGYFIKSGKKLPLQAKLIETDKSYLTPTQVIALEPLAEHALTRAGLVADNDSEYGKHVITLANLVARDAIVGDTDDPETQALNFMTRSIVARYEYADAA